MAALAAATLAAVGADDVYGYGVAEVLFQLLGLLRCFVALENLQL